VEIRPRTTGEVLDDAWRLALADAPFLMLFSALSLVPAFSVLLLLLARPAPAGGAQLVLPALAALLMALTGVGSGACQELFRRRAAGEPVHAAGCLGAALRHGLEHAAARAVLLSGVLLGLPFLLMPSLLLWTVSTPVHPLIAAGAGRSGALFRELSREAAYAPIKAAAVTLSRLPLLLLLVIDLHLLAESGVWVAGDLAGFDTALLSAQLGFLQNPVYTTALFLLGWLLLAPFFEAGNFVLHTDVRTRQEGLDLLYRVQRVFPTAARGVRAGILLVLAGAAWSMAGTARAAEAQLDAVRAVRHEVEVIRGEVKAAEPYPGGRRWEGRLQQLAGRLARSGDGNARRFRWFDRALAGFGARNRDDALHVLDDLHGRLGLLEDTLSAPRQGSDGAEASKPRPSREEVKSALRREEARKSSRSQPGGKKVEEREEPRREEIRRDEPAPEGQHAPGGGGGGPRVSVPAGGGGFGPLGWGLLGGLAVAVLAVAGYLFWSSRQGGPRPPKPARETGTAAAAPADQGPHPLDESPDKLWRQAEGLAGQGRFRDAVRVLYVGVLSLLHQQHLIRYEATRTNGEYVRQVCLSEQAPAELHAPFEELTTLFEVKWYGDGACDAGDWRACRALADDVQRLSADGRS
jgi:hypothetical protein